MDRKVYIILAFDHNQYRNKATEVRKRSGNSVACVFGNSPQRLRGIQADKVITCQGFWERDDAIEIARIAQKRLK